VFGKFYCACHITFVIISISFIPQAIAETPTTSDSGWKVEVGLGYVKTTGNTRTTSVKATTKAEHEQQQWRQSANFEALSASENATTTAERYFASGKVDYKYSKFNYWYLTGSYENDRFSGFDRRTSESIGYGRRLIEYPELTLDTELGPGARQTKFDNGDYTSEFIGRIAAALKWHISEHSEFGEDIYSEYGESTTITKSVSALKAAINSQLAMKLSYTVKYTSEVPDDIANTETESVVTLVYNFH